MSMDNIYDTRADADLPGSSLRNEAADYLRSIYGNAEVEVLRKGKKVDVVCRVTEFGKSTELFVEVKDYGRNLTREEVARICVDYEPVLDASASSKLLLVTRAGLSPSGQESVDGRSRMYHQTIWEMEDAAFALLPYVRAQADVFEEDGLSSYYIPARAQLAEYDADHERSLTAGDAPLLAVVEEWIDSEDPTPIAVLGGYGAGKSSFARQLVSRQARRALEDPAARRPVLVRLGVITRSAGLDSLLGSLFTSEYEVRGYSYRRFKQFNENGRLLVILDGFDEMKHAMTWTEFLNELRELNTLNAGRSKVLLLGRPSAFTSDDEHLEVLRGRLRVDGGATRRLRGWPEFREYELAPFSREERVEFVRRYLTHSAGSGAAGEEAVTRRIEEVNRLADQEPDVFAKPVHARILVELALDHDFDLSAFADGVTRWTLYSQFFQLLARRETEKAARSPIEPRFRLEFLRRVAVWLWEHKDGATSFRASDLPKYILDDLPDGDAEILEDKRREYLAGAFLERKANDAYFFPHRSFAEFLVAEHLALDPPASGRHEHRAALVRGGVADFLEVAPASRRVADWCSTLDHASGDLPIDYLLFLVDRAGGYGQCAALLSEDSCWRPLLSILATSSADLESRQRILSDAILSGELHTIALLLTGLTRFYDLVPVRADTGTEFAPLNDLSLVTAASLVTRIVRSVREKEPGGRHTLRQEDAPVLRLAQAAVVLRQEDDSRFFEFSWSRLGTVAAALAERTGPNLTIDSREFAFTSAPVERLPYFAVRNVMPAKASDFFHRMVLRRGGIGEISIVEQTEKRTPARPR